MLIFWKILSKEKRAQENFKFYTVNGNIQFATTKDNSKQVAKAGICLHKA